MTVDLLRMAFVFYMFGFFFRRPFLFVLGMVANFLYFPFLFHSLRCFVIPGLRELLAVSGLIYALLIFIVRNSSRLHRFMPALMISLSLVLGTGELRSPYNFLLERSLFILAMGCASAFLVKIGVDALMSLLKWMEEPVDFVREEVWGLVFLGLAVVFGGLSNYRIHGSPLLWDPRAMLVLGLFFFYGSVFMMRFAEGLGRYRAWFYSLGLLLLVFSLLGALYSPVSYRIL